MLGALQDITIHAGWWWRRWQSTSQLSSEIVASCLTGFEKSVHVHHLKWRFSFVAAVFVMAADPSRSFERSAYCGTLTEDIRKGKKRITTCVKGTILGSSLNVRTYRECQDDLTDCFWTVFGSVPIYGITPMICFPDSASPLDIMVGRQ